MFYPREDVVHGGAWAVGYFRHIFRGPNFPATKTKVVAGIKKWFYREKVTGLNLTTTFKSDRIMVFLGPHVKKKKAKQYPPLIGFNKCHRGTGMPNWWRIALSAVFWQSQC
jgi:hypothetical protein